MVCPKCNNENPDGNVVCASCGNVLTKVEKNVYNLSFNVKKEEKKEEGLFKSIKNKFIAKEEEKQREEAILNGEEVEEEIDLNEEDDIDLDDEDMDFDYDDDDDEDDE